MTAILKIAICFLNIIYAIIKLFPTNNKKIVMISRQSNKINDDFKLLGHELEKKYKVVYLCKTLDGGVNSKIYTKIGYIFHMFRQMYHLSTSKVCVLDSYSIAVSLLKHKKTLTIIQMWHSVGTMKKFGYSASEKAEGSSKKIAKLMKMHNNYDVIYASSDAYVDHLKAGFGVYDDRYKIFTLPRIDMLFDKSYRHDTEEKIYSIYPELKDKKNVVYSPTFRKDESNFQSNLDNLINYFDFEKYNLIVKLHPLSKVTFSDKRVIVDKKFKTTDMFFIADKVISDYSCVIYEACLLDIPVYFYNYDYDEYEVKRGLAIELKELPGYIECDAKKLVNSLELEYDIKKLKSFAKKYVNNHDNCTIKMVHDIESYL